jgi:hypothetical protein
VAGQTDTDGARSFAGLVAMGLVGSVEIHAYALSQLFEVGGLERAAVKKELLPVITVDKAKAALRHQAGNSSLHGWHILS